MPATHLPSARRPSRRDASRLTTILAFVAAAAASGAAFALTISHLSCGREGVEYAAQEDEVVALSLASAVALAERQAQGHATSALLRREGQAWVYDIHLAGGARKMQALIDANRGSILWVKDSG